MRPQTFKELIIDSFEPVQSEIKWRLQTWLKVLWKKVTNYKLDSNEERFSAPKQGIKKKFSTLRGNLRERKSAPDDKIPYF